MTATPTFFETAAQFRHWFEANHASAIELIVGFCKVGAGEPSMTWAESVDVAPRFGWIDGARTRIDDYSCQIGSAPSEALVYRSFPRTKDGARESDAQENDVA